MHDLVIRNGVVVDGTGAPRFGADVAVDGDRITVGPPPFTPLEPVTYDPHAHDIVCFGRLAEVKGQQARSAG